MGGFGFSEYVPFIDPKLILKKISSHILGEIPYSEAFDAYS